MALFYTTHILKMDVIGIMVSSNCAVKAEYICNPFVLTLLLITLSYTWRRGKGHSGFTHAQLVYSVNAGGAANQQQQLSSALSPIRSGSTNLRFGQSFTPECLA